MPDRCPAMWKPLKRTHPLRCGLPVVPGEIYCPFHLILERRLKERAKKSRRLLQYYREKGGRWMD